MDEWIPTLQRFVAAGLALLLVMLRFEAERFSAAEYDEAKDGRSPSFRRRIAWYGIGFTLITAILFIHPAAREEFMLGAGEDRAKTIIFGFLYGAVGVSVAVGVALYRYHRLRLPDVWSYPGALINAVSTALIDEVTFRGALFGLLLATNLNPTVANVVQALVYALATRRRMDGGRPSWSSSYSAALKRSASRRSITSSSARPAAMKR